MTGKQSTRKPGSTIAQGTISAPVHLRWADRMTAEPTGTVLDWHRASSRVRGA